MANLYEEIMEKVRQGAKLRTDFKTKEIFINGKKITITSELGIDKYDDTEKWLQEVENRYDEYKYSRPTKNSMNRHKIRFKALSVEELIKECGHDALSNPVNRDEALAALELFIIFSLINESINTEKLFGNTWFFQGYDKNLIILKNWF